MELVNLILALYECFQNFCFRISFIFQQQNSLLREIFLMLIHMLQKEEQRQNNFLHLDVKALVGMYQNFISFYPDFATNPSFEEE